MSRSRAKQTRLTFTPLPSSSPAAKDYNKQIQDRAAAVAIDSPAKRRKITHNNGEEGVDDTIPTPAASLQQAIIDQHTESDSEPVRATQKSAKRSTQARQHRIDFSNARDPESFSSPVRLASSPSRPQSSGRPGIFSSQRRRTVVDDSTGSDNELPSPQELVTKSEKPRGRKKRAGSDRQTRSSAPDVQSESEHDDIVVGNSLSNATELDSEEDDDEDMPTTIGTQRRKRQAQRKRRNSVDDFISSSPPRMDDSESEVEIVEERPKKRQRQEVSEDEDEPITPRRKRQMSQREKDELAEDLEDLKSSNPEEEDDNDDDEAGVRAPGTQSSQKTAKGMALERLKRRREGKVTGVEVFTEDEEDEEDPEDDQRPISSAQLFREDEYDNDFVEEEEDQDDILGVPQGIPLKFTRYASMRPKELFKFAVDWMVQKRMNPGFEMTDEIYELTFQKLDDETKGLVGSKFVSAAWTPEFAGALKARPEIAFEALDRHSTEHWMRDKCDACNRSGHPATYQIQFQGTPYHLASLEEVGGNDDEEDDDDSSSETSRSSKGADTEPGYDSHGNEIVPAAHTFYVGKFCMSNAQTAHALQHWRYHLNEYVLTWLKRQGYDTPERLYKLNKLSTRKRGKRARKIVKRMEEEGVVKQLWQDFKQNVEEARNSKQGRF